MRTTYVGTPEDGVGYWLSVEKKSGRLNLKIWPKLKTQLERQAKLEHHSASWLTCEFIIAGLRQRRLQAKEKRQQEKAAGRKTKRPPSQEPSSSHSRNQAPSRKP